MLIELCANILVFGETDNVLRKWTVLLVRGTRAMLTLLSIAMSIHSLLAYATPYAFEAAIRP